MRNIWMMLATLLCLFSLSSHAFTYDKMVVFGDSLSDIGNVFNLSGNIIPRKPPFDRGRFSDGKLWVEYLAESLQLDTTKRAQFSNRAWGGAWASEKGEEYDPIGYFNLGWEVDMYLEKESKHDSTEANHLFVIWIGNNDYIRGDPALDINVVTDNTIEAIITNIERLYQDGARHFMVLNVSDLGTTPSAKELEKTHPGTVDRLTRASLMHNEKLAAQLNAKKAAHPDMKLLAIDIMPYFKDLMQNPAKFNLENVTDACYKFEGDEMDYYGSADDGDDQANNSPASISLRHTIQKTLLTRSTPAKSLKATASTEPTEPTWTVCPNKDKFLYFDRLHPSGVVHQVLGGFMVAELSQFNK